MAVWSAAIAAVLVYLAAVPVKFAWVLCMDQSIAFGGGLALFEGRFALRSARRRMLGEKKHLPWKKTEADILKRAVLPATRKAAGQLHLHLDFLQICGRICTADAARTALICGSADALEGMLLPVFPGKLRIRLQPDFSSGHSEVSLSGMVSTRLGHIIFAALIGAWHYMNLRRKISRGKAPD